jgi:hypothetical protein
MIKIGFWILFTLLITGSLVSHSQSLTIRGNVTDSIANPLPGAAVSLLTDEAAAFVTGSTTDSAGSFVFTGINPGKYKIRISFIGFRELLLTLELGNTPLDLGRLTLQEKSTELKALNVEAATPPAQMKGDTMQYNADAFKINKDANAEDLATKMPGITIQDGKIQAQGEEVKKILLDGKPFLGDDPSAAMKNLPAEVIDKIQVFDKKSDQSAFTGFDDGNTTKTLNIITRPSFRNGTFGRVYAGAGTEELWKSGMNINFFKDKRKISILGNANNINEQNFSTDDLLGVIGTSGGNRPPGQYRGSGSRSYSGGGRYSQQNDASTFLVDSKNGIATTYSTGFNYANQWKKLETTISYFFNRTENTSKSNLLRQYYGENDGLVYREINSGKTTNINHRANLSFEYKFDSLNSLQLQPRISFQKNSGLSLLSGSNTDITGPLNFAESSYNSAMKGYNLSAPLLYRHSFEKKGRTFSVSANPSYNRNQGTSKLYSYTIYTADTVSSDTLNQLSEPDTKGVSVSGDATYTEPVGKNGQLAFTYRNFYNGSNSDKQTLSYSPAEEIYNTLDSSLSNTFESKYLSHSLGSNYRYQSEKWNSMLGLYYQTATLNNEQVFPTKSSLDRTFRSVLPIGFLQYRFNPKKNLRLFFRASTNSPTVSQLQEVVDNTNPLQLSTGNPTLRQNRQYSINLRYSAVNSENNTSFFMYANTTFINDYIGNSTRIATGDSTVVGNTVLASGVQINRPVNIDGYKSFRTFANYSIPFRKIKSNLNFNISETYTRIPSLINNSVNYATTYNSGLGFTLSSNISDKIDFTLSSNASMSNLSNSLQETANSDYFNLNSRIKMQVMPWKGLVLQTDLSHQYNSGLTASYNQNYLLWNGAIGYKFLKDRAAELRLSASDLLEKNTNITRNATDTYYEDVQTNQLQRYFMLTFTYNLKFFNVAKTE